jgi:hypothetical protein
MHLSTRYGTSILRSCILEYFPMIDDATRKEFIATMQKQPLESFMFDP